MISEDLYMPEPNSGCWIWMGRLGGRGYGAHSANGSSTAAHRLMYQQEKGQIPPGYVVDHLCRNVVCVNPAHLEAVTPKENTLRGVGPTAVNAQKTHCPRGHEYTEDNTSFRRGWRHCRACHRDYMREKMREKRASEALLNGGSNERD